MKFQPFGLFKSVTELELEAQNGPAVPRPDPKRIQLTGTETWAEIVAKRLEVCHSCEHLARKQALVFHLEYLKCNLCGCPIQSKTRLSRSTCPKSYW